MNVNINRIRVMYVLHAHEIFLNKQFQLDHFRELASQLVHEVRKERFMCNLREF